MNYSEMLFNRDERLIKEIEILQEDNSCLRKALKTYEKGRYQEHLEVDRLNNIISKAIEYIEQQYKYEETAKEDYDILLDILKGVNKDKEIERLNNIINKIKQRVLDETKPLPSAKEIIDIIGVDKE